jgi:hypothetical protein
MPVRGIVLPDILRPPCLQQFANFAGPAIVHLPAPDYTSVMAPKCQN